MGLDHFDRTVRRDLYDAARDVEGTPKEATAEALLLAFRALTKVRARHGHALGETDVRLGDVLAAIFELAHEIDPQIELEPE